MSQEIMGMTGISMWLEDLIHYLNLRSTILPAPHSVEVNVPFWKNDDLDWQCKPESDDMSNTHFLDISETAQILQHHRHHRFLITLKLIDNSSLTLMMTTTHFIDISETAPPTPQVF